MAVTRPPPSSTRTALSPVPSNRPTKTRCPWKASRSLSLAFCPVKREKSCSPLRGRSTPGDPTSRWYAWAMRSATSRAGLKSREMFAHSSRSTAASRVDRLFSAAPAFSTLTRNTQAPRSGLNSTATSSAPCADTIGPTTRKSASRSMPCKPLSAWEERDIREEGKKKREAPGWGPACLTTTKPSRGGLPPAEARCNSLVRVRTLGDSPYRPATRPGACSRRTF